MGFVDYGIQSYKDLTISNLTHISDIDDEIKIEDDGKPKAEDDLNAQLNPDSEDDSELEEDRLSKGGLVLKGMLKQNDDSSEDDEDDMDSDEDPTKSAVLLQGEFLFNHVCCNTCKVFDCSFYMCRSLYAFRVFNI